MKPILLLGAFLLIVLALPANSQFKLSQQVFLDNDGIPEEIALKWDSSSGEGDFYHIVVYKKQGKKKKIIWEDTHKKFRFYIGDFGVEELQFAGDVDNDGNMEIITPLALSDVSPQGFLTLRWVNMEFVLVEKGYYISKISKKGRFFEINNDFLFKSKYDEKELKTFTWRIWISKFIETISDGAVKVQLMATDGTTVMTGYAEMKRTMIGYQLFKWIRPLSKTDDY